MLLFFWTFFRTFTFVLVYDEFLNIVLARLSTETKVSQTNERTKRMYVTSNLLHSICQFCKSTKTNDNVTNRQKVRMAGRIGKRRGGKGGIGEIVSTEFIFSTRCTVFLEKMRRKVAKEVPDVAERF